jgi:hypothetical protein
MKLIGLSEINLYEVGNSYMMSGVMFSSVDDCFIAVLPGEIKNMDNTKFLMMGVDDWKKFLKQTDIVETEIFTPDEKGNITKSFLRKSLRVVEAFITWNVYKRDNYTCRYCGKSGIPLSVDHVDLWEDGGVTVEDNLITACKKCNKDRGRLPYGAWLSSSIYRKLSANLTPEQKELNEKVFIDLPRLQTLRTIKKRSR